ncbi:MAG: hypothetical protein FWE37_04420 [Spirochaetaceae bacterium]|nr:hypothetical protein [Spirochaetaceae bacterium]
MKVKLLALIFIFLAGWTSPQSPVTIERVIDWQERTVTFYLTTGVEVSRMPAARQSGEALIDRLKVSLIAENLQSLPFDSWGGLTLALPRSGNVNFNLNEIARTASKNYAVFTADMRSLRVAYSLPFESITANVTLQGNGYLPPNIMPSTTPFNYTGLVIYAALPLLVRDDNNLLEYLRPSLLPSIFAENGQSLLTPHIVSSPLLQQWGTAAHSYNEDSLTWPRERVGNNPLVISARGISGSGHSDAIISNSDANRLLASQQGRDILRSGRVLFIITAANDNDELLAQLRADRELAASMALDRD